MKDLKHIRRFNESDENLNISDVSDSDLKKYTDYLIEQYKKINNSHYDGSRIYWDLKQFSDEGRIKDLIKKSDTIKLKIEMLNSFRKDIVNFSKDWDINTEVLSFEDFSNHRCRLS